MLSVCVALALSSTLLRCPVIITGPTVLDVRPDVGGGTPLSERFRVGVACETYGGSDKYFVSTALHVNRSQTRDLRPHTADLDFAMTPVRRRAHLLPVLDMGPPPARSRSGRARGERVTHNRSRATMLRSAGLIGSNGPEEGDARFCGLGLASLACFPSPAARALHPRVDGDERNRDCRAPTPIRAALGGDRPTGAVVHPAWSMVRSRTPQRGVRAQPPARCARWTIVASA